MGDTNFKQNELLSDERKAEIASLARKHYKTLVKGQKFHKSSRKMGTEHEGTIFYPDGSLTSDVVSRILASKPSAMQLTKELGTHQIEQITGPFVQKDGFIDDLVANAKKQREFIQESALANDARFVPIGMVPSISVDDVSMDIIANDPRYKIAMAEAQKDGTECTIYSSNGNIKFDFVGVSLINSTHIHLQGLDADDTVKLFNYSQMLAPVLLALSANSAVFDGQPITMASQQMRIFEQAISPSGNLRRCQLHPGYIDSMDDYFEYALQYLPIFEPGDGNGMSIENKAFDLTTGYYHPWVKPRTENDHFRVEMRSVNVQPSTMEDMALVQLYVLGVQAHIDYKKDLLPFEYVQENFERAARDGIDAMLYWPARGRITQLPAALVAHEVMNLAEGWGRQNGLMSETGEELIDLIRYRTEERMTPGKKFALAVKKYGFDEAFAEYSEHAILDKPYLSRE